jgi:hypothetical protein
MNQNDVILLRATEKNSRVAGAAFEKHFRPQELSEI